MSNKLIHHICPDKSHFYFVCAILLGMCLDGGGECDASVLFCALKMHVLDFVFFK